MMHDPLSPRLHCLDRYQHIAVDDPYRWLEDTTSSGVQRWCRQQDQLTRSYLSRIKQRQGIKERLNQLTKVDIWTVIAEAGSHQLLRRTDGSRNHFSIYIKDLVTGDTRLPFEPLPFPDSENATYEGCLLSPTGRFLAYSVSRCDGKAEEWRILDVERGVDLDIALEASFVKWLPDDSGLYYFLNSTSDSAVRKDFGNNAEVGFCSLSEKAPFRSVGLEGVRGKIHSMGLSDEGDYLVLTLTGISHWATTKIFALGTDPKPFEPFPGAQGWYAFRGGRNNCLWFYSEDGAPRGKVVAVSRCGENWQVETVVPEQPDMLLAVHFAGQRLVLYYLHEGIPYLQLRSLNGRIVRTIELPGIGEITANRFVTDQRKKHTYFEFSGPSHPPTRYRLDLKTGRTAVEWAATTEFDSSRYVSYQVSARGKYGAKIPVKIWHRKDLKLDGCNPTILDGYGAFGCNNPVSYHPHIAAWLEMGGVWAVAEIRGGGEGGEDWRVAGSGANKQNTFSDFIAAAEHLIAAGFTCQSKLAIMGTSAGGMLVAVSMTQRPELFGAAVVFSPSIDALRFAALNPNTTTDRGSVDDREDLEAMIEYAPLLNLRADTVYPHTLACARGEDTTVSPAHAYKFIAALQHSQQGNAPCLLRVEPNADHSGPKPHDAWLGEESDWLCFVANALSVPESPHAGTGSGVDSEWTR